MINDISQCLQQAQALARQIHNIRQKDRNFIKAFTSLAGDDTVGLLAYGIWRGRSRRVSNLSLTNNLRYDKGASVRHTRT